MQLKATPFVLNNGYQIVKANFFYAGLPFDGWYKVTVGDLKPYVKKLGKVIGGECKKDLYITDTNSVLVPGETTSLSVEIFDNEQCNCSPKVIYKTDKWQRTRHWEFYFSQQMHTDLGYTDPPENLPELYSKYLDTVQNFLKKSDNGEYGEIPYKYAVESAWMLADGYMKKRSARQITNVADRVKQGDMSIGAGRYNCNMECMNTEETARSAYYTNRFLVDKLGVKPSTTVRMFDNPAFSKSFVDVAASAGIKYGIHSMNPDRSPYHKKRLYDLFYMEGFTKGNRLLVFNEKSYGECYCFGGTHCDINDPTQIGGDKTEEALLNLIDLLEKRTGRRSYPYDKFPLPLIPNGDNKPPLEKQVEVANDLNLIWKKKGYAYPKIKSAFPDEFFEDVEREYSALIPIETGTEENWWVDGWGTAAYESGINKQAGPLIVQTETLSAVNSALFVGSTKETSLRDITVTSDDCEIYTYFVRGCASGVKGEKSNGAAVKVGKAEIDIITQSVLTVTPRSRGEIDLFWTPDCKGNALRYDVYRDGIKIAETSDGYVCSFRDKHVSYPCDYTYRVVTVGFDGNSASSDEVKVNHSDVFFKENPVSKKEKKTPFKKFYDKVLWK